MAYRERTVPLVEVIALGMMVLLIVIGIVTGSS